MEASSRRDSRGPILGATVIILVAACGHAFTTLGPGELGIRLVIRQTARISLVAFSLAFAASSLLRLRPGPATRWVMRNRRWVGLSFALSHLVHLVAIFRLDAIAADFEVETATLLFGGFAYVVVAALAATSFNGAVRRLGSANWHRLHKTGMYYLWLIFALSYFPRALESSGYIAPAVLVAAALAVRAAAATRS